MDSGLYPSKPIRVELIVLVILQGQGSKLLGKQFFTGKVPMRTSSNVLGS